MSITENFSHPKGTLGRFMLATMNLGHSPMAKWTFKQFDIPKDADIVDIGCGGGANVKRMLALAPNGHVFGVDISEESVKKTKKVNKAELGKRCRVFQGSVEKLPFKNGVLDLATAFETVYFWPDLVSSFQEVKRVLKEGGRFLVSCDTGDPDKNWEEKIPHMKMYTAQDIKGYMELAGFIDIEVSINKNMFCVIGHV